MNGENDTDQKTRLIRSDTIPALDQLQSGQPSGRQGMMRMILGRCGRERIRLDHCCHIDLKKLLEGGY